MDGGDPKVKKPFLGHRLSRPPGPAQLLFLILPGVQHEDDAWPA